MKPSLNSEVQDFLMENSSKYLAWPEESLRSYLDFYSDQAAMGIVRIKDKIVGVGFARPVDLIQIKSQVEDRYHVEKRGDVLFVDELCVSQKSAIPILWNIMKEILGERAFIAAKRHKRLRLWRFDTYEEKMNILNKKG